VKPLHLAQYIANRFGNVPGGVTPLKAQKLLYYVKAWGLVDGYETLVEGEFEKWRHGPVNPEVYRAFREYGAGRIPFMASAPEPDAATQRVVDFVAGAYSLLPAVALSSLTHQEAPWKEAQPNAVIEPEAMRSFYSHHPFAQNAPFSDYDKPFMPVESDLSKAFTLDMSQAEAKASRTYASYHEYLEQVDRLQQQQGYRPHTGWLSEFMA
jgi:uncharacterized phage-associated protein